jgi:hypothetical protein
MASSQPLRLSVLRGPPVGAGSARDGVIPAAPVFRSSAVLLWERALPAMASSQPPRLSVLRGPPVGAGSARDGGIPNAPIFRSSAVLLWERALPAMAVVGAVVWGIYPAAWGRFFWFRALRATYFYKRLKVSKTLRPPYGPSLRYGSPHSGGAPGAGFYGRPWPKSLTRLLPRLPLHTTCVRPGWKGALEQDQDQDQELKPKPKPSEAKPSQTKPKPSQAKPGQTKPHPNQATPKPKPTQTQT